MKKFLIVSYSFLFSLFFAASCMASVNFTFDGDDKIISPTSISLAGIEMKCVGITLSELYTKISGQKNFIGAKIKSDDMEYIGNQGYQDAINDLLVYAADRAWTPKEYAGKTADEIFTNVTQNNKNISPLTFINKFKDVTPASVKDALMAKALAYGNQPEANLNQPQKTVANPPSSPTTIATSPSPTTVATGSSKDAGEWQFVFKNVYEDLLKNNGVLPSDLLSTDAKTMGPITTALLQDELHAKMSYVQYLQDLLKHVRSADISVTSDLITAPDSIDHIEVKGKNVTTAYKLTKKSSLKL